MSGDIVERLADEFVPEREGHIVLAVVDSDLLRDARAEIVRLQAGINKLAEENYQRYVKIERLRAAGDAMAVRYRKTFGLDGMFDAELRQWEAACRE